MYVLQKQTLLLLVLTEKGIFATNAARADILVSTYAVWKVLGGM